MLSTSVKRLRGFALSATVGLMALAPVQSAQAAFAANESLVTSQWDLIDPEYSQSRGQVVWSDSKGSLWVASIDPATGLFVPSNGKGTLIDANATTTADFALFGNGPEWVSTSKGDFIVYTRFSSGATHSALTAKLGIAETTDGVTWTPRFIDATSARNAPYASKDKGDSRPRISYVDPTYNHYWREIYDSSTETMVTAYPPSARSLRFVKGARAAVFVAPVNGISQVFRYDLDTKAVLQLTFDAGNKDLHSVPWMWQAPEFANDFVVSTLVDDKELRVYRHTDLTAAAWSPIYVAPLSSGLVPNSPEPFTYKSKSYVFFAAGPSSDQPNAIWLTNIVASAPMIRQLTPASPSRLRSDPEVYVTNAGPYIYYNRFKSSGLSTTCATCLEGVYRTYTGLPAK